LAGVLIKEGALDLWERVPIAEWQKTPGDVRGNIRLADLLRMSSGLRAPGTLDAEPPLKTYLDGVYVYTGSIDTALYTITRPPAWPPGTVGRYRNTDTVVVSYLIKQALAKRGIEPKAFAQRALFDKIGIRTILFETDAYGNSLAHGYTFGSARDWARLGMLLLQDGVWNAERILPQGFVSFMTTPAPAWHADGRPWYGASVWLRRGNSPLWPGPEDSYAMVGAAGQSAIMFPTHDLVVVRMVHAKGEESSKSGEAVLKLLQEAVPQSRPPQTAQPARP
jgi:CubicO group peptidase (beta-lactamase class C family)